MKYPIGSEVRYDGQAFRGERLTIIGYHNGLYVVKGDGGQEWGAGEHELILFCCYDILDIVEELVAL